MNINSVDNSFNWSGTRKTETIFSKAGSFASKLNAAKKSKEPINQNSPAAFNQKINGLSDDDYKQLALKFNPRNMTLDDYNSFLDYLQSKDVISDNEKRRIGYNGTVVKQVDSMVGAYYSEEPVVDNFIVGNVLAFTRSQGSLVYSNPLSFNEETKGLYRKITAIFERMLQENS
ncbi:hypothetical protein VSQ48_22505 [Candidatus Ventrimonas sp. KK005]